MVFHGISAVIEDLVHLANHGVDRSLEEQWIGWGLTMSFQKIKVSKLGGGG